MKMQMTELLLYNLANRQYAIEEGIGDLLMVIVVVMDPNRRNNEVTGLFKQTLRIVNFF